MIKYLIHGALASVVLVSINTGVPAPAHACNIANPPPPCANLPGGNPVSGTGTLFQNRFQGVPGATPGGGDDSFFFDDPWQLNDRWEFPSASSGTGAGKNFLSRRARQRAINDELDQIQREFRDNLDAISDPVLQAQTVGLMSSWANSDEHALELEEENRRLYGTGPVGGVNGTGSSNTTPDPARQGDNGADRKIRDNLLNGPVQGPLLQSDNADITDEHESIMDEIESVIVKM